MLNEREAAAYLGLSKNTLRVWRCAGRGPVFHKMGKLIRYDAIDLDAYKQQSRRYPVVRAEQERNVAV